MMILNSQNYNNLIFNYQRSCDISNGINGNGNGNSNNGNNGANYIKRSSSSNKNKNGAISEYGISLDSLLPAVTTSWQPSNVNECVQPKLNELKNEIYAFTNNDNFDETLIVPYLERLLDLTLKHLSSTSAASASVTSTVATPHLSSRSIHDVSAIIDAMFNLINAQVNISLVSLFTKTNSIKYSQFILSRVRF